MAYSSLLIIMFLLINPKHLVTFQVCTRTGKKINIEVDFSFVVRQ